MGDEVAADPAAALLRIRDLHGRLYGLGFLADRQGTVVTAHETVAGLPRVVLHTPGGQARVLGPESVDLLPARGLALLRTAAVGGLPGPALPIAADATARLIAVPHQRWEDGEPVLVQGGVVGRDTVMYPYGEAFHLVEGALLLELAGTPLAGAPVLDAETGAVLGVVAPRLRGGPEGAVRAASLGGAGADRAGPLGALLARNAADVPAYGRALNLGGVLRIASAQLAAASAGHGRIADLAADRVDRADGISGEEPQQPLTVLLGETGSGRTTELAALTVRRSGGGHPLPTLWLRGADLEPADRSLADAVQRALAGAAGTLGVPVPGADAVAALCEAAGRPLLVVLDGPEEAPLALGQAWLRAGGEWLRRCGARLLTACRPDGWEQLAGWHGEARLLWLGGLPAEAAARAARRYGLPEGYLAPSEAGHALVLRLGGELAAAGARGPVPGREEAFAGWFDLGCLRVARRVAAARTVRRPGAHRRGGPLPAGEDAGQVRRLAAEAAGRLHDAARLMLGAGHGGLAAAEFERLFPVAGGWARAVVEARLLTPAGAGYRPGHEEWGEWLQGLHLDLDAALRLLLTEQGEKGADGGDPWARGPAPTPGAGERGADGRERGADGSGAGTEEALHGRREAPLRPGGGRAGPAEEPAVGGSPGVPEGGGGPAGASHGVGRGRAGVVVAALRRVGEVHGAGALDVWLHRIRLALDRVEPGGEADWWAGRLLAAGVTGSPDVAVHRELLAVLAERARSDPRFGAAFWAALPLAPVDRLGLLRRLVGVDTVFDAATAELLTADPGTVLPLLCGWFEGADERAGDLAEELLFTHRALALDELTEVLVGAAHPRADRLLGRLAVQEPSALCRAVDRWSHDPRPERHVAAAVHARRTAPHAGGSGRRLLRHAARRLLAREDEPALHGAALALLLDDPECRAEYLPAALAAYRAEDPFLTPEVLVGAVADHPEQVLAALRERLAAPAAPVREVLAVLAAAEGEEAAEHGRRFAAELLRERPERAGQVAEFLDALLAAGRDARPLLAEVLAAAPAVRVPFAAVLAAPDGGAETGTGDGRDGGTERTEVPGRGRLLDSLLAAEQDPDVLVAVLERLADRYAEHEPGRLRELLRRIGGRWDGADAVLARCAGRSAGFARLLAQWPAASEAERRTDHTEPLPVPRQGRAHGTL
ncbi:hypothetical protein ACGFX4_37995 [Kitasatospora sp. NPDC048365]|uniref:hypothetical protein n=1 Tax=Kitasatospora sp. NPDC048365 TaxID=3364050 RepID=UPI003718155A